MFGWEILKVQEYSAYGLACPASRDPAVLHPALNSVAEQNHCLSREVEMLRITVVILPEQPRTPTAMLWHSRQHSGGDASSSTPKSRFWQWKLSAHCVYAQVGIITQRCCAVLL